MVLVRYHDFTVRQRIESIDHSCQLGRRTQSIPRNFTSVGLAGNLTYTTRRPNFPPWLFKIIQNFSFLPISAILNFGKDTHLYPGILGGYRVLFNRLECKCKCKWINIIVYTVSSQVAGKDYLYCCTELYWLLKTKAQYFKIQNDFRSLWISNTLFNNSYLFQVLLI